MGERIGFYSTILSIDKRIYATKLIIVNFVAFSVRKVQYIVGIKA